MKELESLEWILNSKEHRHFSTLKQSMKDKTSDVLAGASGEHCVLFVDNCLLFAERDLHL